MTTAVGDREAIRAELAATRAAFYQLLNGLTAADWRRQTGNPAWTVGDLLHHLVSSLELLPREVAYARQGKGMYNLPPFLRDPLNATITRLGARRQSLPLIAQRYDAAYAAALRTLDAVQDNEWRRGARFWSEGFLDIEGLFRAQAHHFAEHGAEIAAALPSSASVTSQPNQDGIEGQYRQVDGRPLFVEWKEGHHASV